MSGSTVLPELLETRHTRTHTISISFGLQIKSFNEFLLFEWKENDLLFKVAAAGGNLGRTTKKFDVGDGRSPKSFRE